MKYAVRSFYFMDTTHIKYPCDDLKRLKHEKKFLRLNNFRKKRFKTDRLFLTKEHVIKFFMTFVIKLWYKIDFRNFGEAFRKFWFLEVFFPFVKDHLRNMVVLFVSKFTELQIKIIKSGHNDL